MIPLSHTQKNPMATLMIMHGNCLVSLAFLVAKVTNFSDNDAPTAQQEECEILKWPPYLLFISRIFGLVTPIFLGLLNKFCTTISEDVRFFSRLTYFVAGPLAWISWSLVV